MHKNVTRLLTQPCYKAVKILYKIGSKPMFPQKKTLCECFIEMGNNHKIFTATVLTKTLPATEYNLALHFV